MLNSRWTGRERLRVRDSRVPEVAPSVVASVVLEHDWVIKWPVISQGHLLDLVLVVTVELAVPGLVGLRVVGDVSASRSPCLD